MHHLAVDWKDKKVAVIGTGSSAIQMVPQLQKSEWPPKSGGTNYTDTKAAAKEVVAFMRSVTWFVSMPLLKPHAHALIHAGFRRQSLARC
jgi:hypothetical protein